MLRNKPRPVNQPKGHPEAPAPVREAAPERPRPDEQVSRSILKRVYWVVGIFLVGAVLVVGQVIRIQFVQQQEWLTEGSHPMVYPRKVLADRGSILADDNSVLAVTLPFYRFAMDATVLEDDNFENLNDSLHALCEQLAAHFGEEGQDTRYFLNKIKVARAEGDRHVYLFSPGRRFGLQDLKTIQNFPILRRGRFKGGFIVEKVNNKRFYPLGELAKITLGRLSDDTTGTRGIEFSFNQLLRGSDGSELVQRVAGGLEVPVDYFSMMDSRDGYDVITTLNVNLQDVAYNALKEAVIEHQAQRGTVILMETETGHIKALANYPEDFNMAVAAQFEPGSTFKTASVMAAMEDGYVTRNDTIDTGNKGYIRYYEQETMRDEDPYGKITLQQAIERSSNIAISKLIHERYKANPEKFLARLDEMGVLGLSQFQLKGEPEPYVIRPGNPLWSGVTLPWLSTGYNLKITPLQMLTFYNAIANGGRMMAPMIVQEVRDGAERVRSYSPQVIREQICSPRTLAQIREMLEGVVERGTAKAIYSPGLRLAGKSGTAKKLENGHYENKYRASFAGFFPADNPRYSCIVVIDEPSGGEYYGSKVAAPVFRRIADYIYSTRHQGHFRTLQASAEGFGRLPSSRVTTQSDAMSFLNAQGIATPNRPGTEFVRAVPDGALVDFKPVRIRKGLVPDLRGMSSRNALALLENMGLRVRMSGHGKVASQSLPPGRRIKFGELIFLTLND